MLVLRAVATGELEALSIMTSEKVPSQKRHAD